MKTFYLFIFLWLFSLLIMLVVDYSIGAKAEFINAYSVLQRLLGQEPSAGLSMVARKYGAVGELIGVLVINMLAGLVLTFMVKWLSK